jgi:hypothetical protein
MLSLAHAFRWSPSLYLILTPTAFSDTLDYTVFDALEQYDYRWA